MGRNRPARPRLHIGKDVAQRFVFLQPGKRFIRQMQQLCRCLRVAFSGTQADIDARKRLFGDKTGHTLRRRIRKRFPFGRRIRNQPHARILPDGAWHAQPGQPRTLTLRALPVVKHAELKQRYLFFRQNKIDFTRAQIGERLHAAVDFRRQVCPKFRRHCRRRKRQQRQCQNHPVSDFPCALALLPAGEPPLCHPLPLRFALEPMRPAAELSLDPV